MARGARNAVALCRAKAAVGANEVMTQELVVNEIFRDKTRAVHRESISSGALLLLGCE